MALPHYKLQNQMAVTPATEEFPILLAPADAPSAKERFRNALCNKKSIYSVALIGLGCAAFLIWQSFEPHDDFANAILRNPYLLGSTIALVLSAALLLIIAVLKKKQENFAAPTLSLLPPAEPKPLTLAKVLAMPPPASSVVEWRCEQWHSAPFLEVLEESVVAEVFSDEMLAPDYLVLSLDFQEDK